MQLSGSTSLTSLSAQTIVIRFRACLPCARASSYPAFPAHFHFFPSSLCSREYHCVSGHRVLLRMATDSRHSRLHAAFGPGRLFTY